MPARIAARGRSDFPGDRASARARTRPARGAACGDGALVCAEPLGTSVAAALRDSIAAELGNDRLVTYPWSAVDVDYQIEVAFVRFETQSNGDTQMAARWSVRDVHRAMEVIRRETTRAQKVAPHDRAASTAALSTMLSDLGHEIAEAVRDLPPAPPRKTATK